MSSLSLEWWKALLAVPMACFSMWASVTIFRKEKGIQRIIHTAACACGFAAVIASILLVAIKPSNICSLSQGQTDDIRRDLMSAQTDGAVLVNVTATDSRDSCQLKLGKMLADAINGVSDWHALLSSAERSMPYPGVDVEVAGDASVVQTAAADSLAATLSRVGISKLDKPVPPPGGNEGWNGEGRRFDNAKIRIWIAPNQ